MSKNAAVFYLTAGLLTAASASYALRSNDFTRANGSFSRKYESENSALGEQKSRFNGMDMDKKSFTSPDNASSLVQKRSWLTDNSSAASLSSKRDVDASKSFASPDYKGKIEDYWQNGKTASVLNSDVDLSKKYEGKIDVSKRNTDKQKYIDEYYGSLSERSMQEINKYYSRTSVSDSETDVIKTAGGKINPEESGFFDFLTGDEHIKRPQVMFKGPEKKTPKPEAEQPAPAAQTLPEKPFIGVAGPHPQNAVKQINEPASAVPTQVADGKKSQVVRKDSNVISETAIDPDVAKRTQFMKVPEDLRSKATIKVQVKENDF